MRKLAETISDAWGRLGGDDDEMVGHAQQFLEWARQDYHGKFLKWLEEQAGMPVKASNEFELLTGTARANAMKEIRFYLIDQAKKASIVLDRERNV